MVRRRLCRLGVVATLWTCVLLGGSAVVHVVAAPARPTRLPTPELSVVDVRLSQVVERVARGHAVVVCWSSAGWRRKSAELSARTPSVTMGAWGAYTTGWNLDRVNLSPEVCAELSRLSRTQRPVRRSRAHDAIALSAGVLAHESQHVRGYFDEAEAECYGMQAVSLVARMLGRTAAEGRYLARRYWRRWYPSGPASYRTNQCRDGGGLDLHPASTVWP